MSNAQHTPGPWRYAKCNCGDPMCSAFHISHARSNGGFSEEDARLIAAAPGLLAELEFQANPPAILSEMGAEALRDYIAAKAQSARAAIAKAKGEQA